MILIADSGSSKTNWRLIDGQKEYSLNTKGINPYHARPDEIKNELESLDLGVKESEIDTVCFYGSGLANDEMKAVVREHLLKRFGVHAEYVIEDDLTGVARALFQQGEGIACILGTGSNSGIYRDGAIRDKVPALGYSLGDEGSGTDIGKRLVNALLKRNLNEKLAEKIMQEEGIRVDEVLERVYKQPHANRYLASMAKVAARHIHEPEIRALVSDAFRAFIEKNIARYDNYHGYPLGFAGSIAYHFREVLQEVLAALDLKSTNIIAAPIDGLCRYHLELLEAKQREMVSITESTSRYDNLDKMSVRELLENINREDSAVPVAVQRVIPRIEQLVEGAVKRLEKGGRLFYVGAGTSGRLGILDASEIPPTFGVPFDIVIGIIAGGDGAIRKAVESAEDDWKGAWRDLEKYKPGRDDVIVGIAASGRTPYVIGAVRDGREAGLLTACITNNPNSKLAAEVDIAIEALVGPEFVTGSTRMKSGTAQKLILNMITTTTMIRLGRVKGNKMVDMQLTNEKLVRRGTRMICEETGLPAEEAKRLLLLHGSVRKAVEAFQA